MSERQGAFQLYQLLHNQYWRVQTNFVCSFDGKRPRSVVLGKAIDLKHHHNNMLKKSMHFLAAIDSLEYLRTLYLECHHIIPYSGVQ
jgi:hypothetical protein